MPSPTAQRWTALVSPMSLAAYAAWAAVWFSVASSDAVSPALGTAARICTVLFLVLFIAEDALSSRLGQRGFAMVASILAVCALVASAAVPYSAAPILLVLLSAMLAARYEGAPLWAWMIAVNNRTPGALLPRAIGDLAGAAAAGYLMIFALEAASVAFTVYGPAMIQARHHVSPLVAGYVITAIAGGWTLTALAVARLRVAFRRHRRERKRAAEHYMLRHAMRDLPDHIRRDIGLPPY